MAPGTQTPVPDTPGQWGGETTWNVEVWGIDVKAGSHWGVLLVLYLPVLWRELGQWQHPRVGVLPPASWQVLRRCCSPGGGRETQAARASCPRTLCPRRSST